jgi:hypothetical protein
MKITTAPSDPSNWIEIHYWRKKRTGESLEKMRKVGHALAAKAKEARRDKVQEYHDLKRKLASLEIEIQNKKTKPAREDESIDPKQKLNAIIDDNGQIIFY